MWISSISVPAASRLAPVATIVANVDTRFHDHDHALRIGLNYALGGPVIAKY
jgi:outer membrane immunogenic protein